MIDLHLHTTASDGRLTPEALVARARHVGITVMSVTDHDTVAGLADARAFTTSAGIELIDGIEITAVAAGRDVHVLGYFLDTGDSALGHFLQRQRARRLDRAREIGERLARLAVPIDIEELLAAAAFRPGTSVGRPAIARALVAAGHVPSMQDAFDRYLAAGQPAFVPRVGPSPADVVDTIHRAQGIASLAHPGVTGRWDLMTGLVEFGLDAIEVYHSDHTPEVQRELTAFVARYQLLATGGSDFHGDEDRARPLGGVTLPPRDFDRLQSAAQARRVH